MSFMTSSQRSIPIYGHSSAFTIVVKGFIQLVKGWCLQWLMRNHSHGSSIHQVFEIRLTHYLQAELQPLKASAQGSISELSQGNVVIYHHELHFLLIWNRKGILWKVWLWFDLDNQSSFRYKKCFRKWGSCIRISTD